MSKWYNANYTNDKLDIQKAREFRSKYGVYSNSLFPRLGDIVLAFVVMFMACLIPTVIAAVVPILGIPLIFIVAFVSLVGMMSRKGIQEKYESEREGFRQWIIWKKTREDGYYGGGTSVKLVIEICTRIPTTYGEKDLEKFQRQQHADPWTCDLKEMPWIDPLDFLTKTDENHYDYTTFLEELAYYNMIYCSRKKWRATLVSFAECVAERFANGSMVAMRYAPMQRHHCDPQEPISVAFPIDEQQGEALREFDYLAFDTEGEGQWLKQIWANATKRYFDTLQGEDYVMNPPRSYFEEKERSWRSIINSSIKQSYPPAGFRGDRKLYAQMHAIPQWDVYVHW